MKNGAGKGLFISVGWVFFVEFFQLLVEQSVRHPKGYQNFEKCCYVPVMEIPEERDGNQERYIF